MAARSSILTVTTTPALLATGGDTDGNASLRDLAVQNNSAVTVYLGASDVTAATGFPIAAGAGLTLSSISPQSIPYAVVATSTAAVAVLELGV